MDAAPDDELYQDAEGLAAEGPPTLEPPAEKLAAEGAASMARATRKLFLLVIVVAAALVVAYLTPFGTYIRDLNALKLDLAGSGPWILVAIPVATAVLISVGFPRLLFCILSGFLVGFWKGFLLSYLGSVVGSYMTFLVARALGRQWVELVLRDRARMREFIQSPGVVAVFWIRQLPLTSAVLSLGLGMTGVRHWVYLVGTSLGLLPAAIVVTLIGSGLGTDSPTSSALQTGLALAAAAFTVVALLKFHRKAREALPPDRPSETSLPG
jgi:uncharacterized membrane protein YdjX (TVP38/TMEM64 family)